MSLVILACRCANSEPLARRALQRSHRSDWLTVPIIKGQNACFDYLDSLPDNDNIEIGSLRSYIAANSSWAVVLGSVHRSDGSPQYRWADADIHNAKADADFELVCEYF